MKHFEDFYLQVNLTVNKKSDNIRMLLANVKVYLAKEHEKVSNNYDALNCLEEAMDVLEGSLIPPVLLYYQIYRYFGILQDKVGNTK